jgi:hypothetical protein
MYDGRQCNTVIIDLPCHRLIGSSTSRSRFRTQAHLRQALARYLFIHSERFDLCLSPMEKHNYHHAAPMLNTELLGFTLRWEYMLLSGYIHCGNEFLG